MTESSPGSGLPVPSSCHMTIADFQALKGKRKSVCLTAYTAPMAALLDRYCDLLLVGDSVGMVIYGMADTRSVSLDMMIRHGQAVMRRRQTAMVVIDLPCGSYEDSPEQALASATAVLQQTGADAVKLEGGTAMAPTIRYLRDKDIQVMGHIGLLPQSAARMQVTGRGSDEAMRLAEDMAALVKAGVFSLVIEAVIEPVATKLAKACLVPTIGIGASPACDGQILVTEDMLGLGDGHRPKFVRSFATVQQQISAAVAAYHKAVTDGAFPAEAELYKATSLD